MSTPTGRADVSGATASDQPARPSAGEVDQQDSAQDSEAAHRDRVDYERSLTLFTELVRTRFQLLGLLPLVSGGVIALLDGLSTEPLVLVGPAFLGLVTTSGLVLYEVRNSQIHDNLVHRLRHLERLLGLSPATPTSSPVGGFFTERSGRQIYLLPVTSDWSDETKPEPEPRLKVRHDAGLSLVYGSVLAAWGAFFAWNAALATWTALRVPAGVASHQGSVVAAVVTVLVALAAGVGGGSVVAATSRMGRNRARAYVLAPLAEELRSSEEDPADAVTNAAVAPVALQRLLELGPPRGGTYAAWKEAAGKELVSLGEALGVVAHRRRRRWRAVEDLVTVRTDTRVLAMSMAAVVGLREVHDALGRNDADPETARAAARRASIVRYGVRAPWCSDREIDLRIAWLTQLEAIADRCQTSRWALTLSDCSSAEVEAAEPR